MPPALKQGETVATPLGGRDWQCSTVQGQVGLLHKGIVGCFGHVGFNPAELSFDLCKIRQALFMPTSRLPADCMFVRDPWLSTCGGSPGLAWHVQRPVWRSRARVLDASVASVARWAWNLYEDVLDACTSLEAGEHGCQQLRGTAVVRSVREHRHAVFLDVNDVDDVARVEHTGARDTLQVVVPLNSTTAASTELLRPGILLSLSGCPGRTRKGQTSLFADGFAVKGVTPAASPSLLATLLSCALAGVVRRKDVSRWLHVTEGELDAVLDADVTNEAGRRSFCSRRARFLRLGREHRARRRQRSLTAEEHRALEAFQGWGELLRNCTAPLPEDCAAPVLASLGHVDPVANLGGARPHLEVFSKNKKRPQVQAMTRLVSELRQLAHDANSVTDEGSVDVVDVGGGRGDLAMAVAALLGARVSVVESFAPSAYQGQHRARELNLAVDFRISSAVSLSSQLEEQERSPIVMALHACGGLTDVALEACAKLRLPFCICPCCYASQPQLRSRPLAPQEQVLQGLAESNDLPRDVSQMAAFGINGLRLRHLDPLREGSKSSDHPDFLALTPQLPPSWIVRVYTFPREWSSRNLVLWGHPREMGSNKGGAGVNFCRPSPT